MTPVRALAIVLAIATTAGRPSAAGADHLRVVVAGGASIDGPVGRAELAGRAGSVFAAIRADDTIARLGAVVGVGPRVVRRPTRVARWDEPCLARLARAGSERCWIAGARRDIAAVPASTGWVGAVAGVRRDEHGRIAAIAAVRFHPTSDVLGDVIELGATGVVAGRDRLFVQHLAFAPGWYARAQTRIWHVVLGAEVGTTGLASRTPDGAFRAEVFAAASIGMTVGL